ncbi:MAG TPA: PKD domain-containing protein [Dehalococcoidia bacterium]|nr:PKD domain-containing protein [Dehalococcoidia bacterium]
MRSRQPIVYCTAKGEKYIFRQRGLSVAATALALLITLYGACSPKPPSAPPAAEPSGNQPPVVSNLTVAQTQVYPSESVQVQCIASDPDGDPLKFSWSCTGGEFSGAGASVIWRAPARYGTYAVTVTVGDGRGGSTEASVNIAVGANQPPVISSLAATSSVVVRGGSTIITCTASDPDGDEVSYSWSTSGGSITGVGNKVTWMAPDKAGNFNITVIVSDGKGGETIGNVVVVVSAVTRTVTINPVAQESGTVDSTGDKDTSRTIAGDDEKNAGYCAFWSFDVWSLAGKKIENASLKFTTSTVVGNPFPATTGLGGLWLWKVTYGDKLPKFHYTGSKLYHSPLMYKPPAVIDVTPEIASVTAAAITRFQVEALFNRVSNGNNVAEWIEWSEVVLEVTYSER